MKIAKNKVVTMHYTLTLDDGSEVDTSVGGEPLMFLFGSGQIITGLENALNGKTKGDKLKVKVAPDDGYGEWDEALVQEVPKASFEDVKSITVGMQFHAMTQEGPLSVTVVKVENETVTVDGNHPLAGQNLNFDVNVVDVREPSKDELTHGHAHGPGGHEH